MNGSIEFATGSILSLITVVDFNYSSLIHRARCATHSGELLFVVGVFSQLIFLYVDVFCCGPRKSYFCWASESFLLFRQFEK